MARWQYHIPSKTYIDAEGNPLSQATLNEVRDAYLGEMDDLIAAYADNLEKGDWSVTTFETEMRRRLKDAYIAEYVLGKGGVSQVTQSDYGRLGNMLKAQYKHLRNFLDDIGDEKETRGTVGNRARNFIGSARQAFSRGRGRAYGLDLPYHPADGGTPCHGACRCHWDIDEDENEWRAYWKTTANESCAGCQSRAAESAPYVQVKETPDA